MTRRAPIYSKDDLKTVAKAECLLNSDHPIPFQNTLQSVIRHKQKEDSTDGEEYGMRSELGTLVTSVPLTTRQGACGIPLVTFAVCTM